MISELHSKKPKILIIEDSKIVRDALANFLKQEGFDDLYFAENGEEGITLLKKVSPVVIILDLHMPVMDGISFLEKIQLKSTDPYIVTVLTGYADDAIMKKCYDLGINFFLRKPCNHVEFCSVVKRAIEIKKTEELIATMTKNRINLERALKDKEMKEKLRQADKMISLGTMAAGVAHDLNNPLSVATGDICLLKRDFSALHDFINHFLKISLHSDEAKNIEKLKQDMDLSYILGNFDNKLFRCEEAMGRIKEIVLSLMSFSRLDAGEIVDIDITKEIKSSLEMIPERYKRGLEIKTEFSPLPKIACYGRQVGQVFLNVIVNAFQAMNGYGMLKIKTTLSGEHIFMDFCDTGPGIPEEKIKQIFNTFYTTKPIGEGTGLGLSICKSIIENHKGEISAANNPDKGVTFTIKLLKGGVKKL